MQHLKRYLKKLFYNIWRYTIISEKSKVQTII